MSESQRFRARIDIPDDLIRAVRARAGFDGVEINVVIARALEAYLQDELAMLRKKQADAEAKESPKTRKSKDG